MKKIMLCLLVLAILASLCGCNSGGAQRGDNPVPNKAQSVAGVNPESSSPSSRDDSQIRKIVQGLIANESDWANAERMPESGIAGFYATGYMFFDIDLDGNKDLLVQLGTTEELHCETLAYSFDNDGHITPIKKSKNLSYSAENLTLWEDDEGNRFYLNHYSRLEGNHSIEVWNKLTCVDGTIKETNLFRAVYDIDSKPTSSQESSQVSSAESQPVSSSYQYYAKSEYFIGSNDKAVSKDNFDKSFNEFRGKLTQISVKTIFIRSKQWALYTNIQKENEMLSALQ